MIDRDIKCPLCGSDNIYLFESRLKQHKEIDALECRDCSLVFLSGSPCENPDYYKNNEMPTDGDTMEEIDSHRRASYFNDTYQRFFKKILDFGCGSGKFLSLLKQNTEAKFELSALEPNTKYKEFLSSNFKLYENIDDLPDNTFDYITMFHVLEHLKNPIEVINKLYDKLSLNGQLIIEVPNINDALISFYKLRSAKRHLLVPWHLYYYNAVTLTLLTAKTKFKINSLIEGIQRYPLANHLYWLAYELPGGHLIWEKMSNPDINREYTKLLTTNNMTDTLLLTLRKE